MTPCFLLRNTAKEFRKSGIPDPETDSALLLSFLTGQPPLSLRLDTETVLSSEVLESFHSIAKRRISREPLQYITGEAPFGGRIFTVDHRVLFPRPETEELCSWALEILPSAASCRILDLCCGSGCIGLTLAAERPDYQLTLADISADALQVASLNASRFHLQVSFHRGDLTENLPADFFDCIISNPPYIPSSDCLHLQPEVLREPVLALDGGMDGLDFYRRIAVESAAVLKQNGLLMLEIGSGEADQVSDILSHAGFTSVEIRYDLRKIPRMIKAVFTERRAYV